MTNVKQNVRIYNICCEFMVLPSCAMLCLSWEDKADSDKNQTVRDQLRGVQQIQATGYAFAASLEDGFVAS